MEYRIARGVHAQPLGDSIVLFHPLTERLLSVNSTGRRIWELLADGVAVNGIITRLQQEFADPHPQVWKQVLQFLSQLEDEQMILRER